MKKFLILFSVLLVFTLTYVSSKSTRVTQIPNGTKFSCNTCHTNGGGSSRNAFGEAVEGITGTSLTEFWSPALAALDSDGDGWTNGQELQDSTGTWTTGNAAPGDFSLVTNPGDPTSHPDITSVAENEIPESFILYDNYPNPFNPTTTIKFEVPENSIVKVEVFSIIGELVKTLVDEEVPEGIYTTKWNATDLTGNRVGSGIYIYSLSTKNERISKKMILLK